MAMTFVEVSAYQVFIYGGPAGNSGADASVSLTIPDAYAFLRFYPEGSAVAVNTKVTHISGKPIYYLNYRYAQFSSVVDLLRNEKPVRFFFRDDTMAGYLTTSPEPVGEGEA